MERNLQRYLLHKKELEEQARKENSLGQDWSNCLIKKAVKMFQGKYENISEKFQELFTRVEEKYKKLEIEIDEVVQKLLELDEEKLLLVDINKSFEKLINTTGHSEPIRIYHQWHDLLLNIDIEIKRQLGSNYDYSFDCSSFEQRYYPLMLKLPQCDKCNRAKTQETEFVPKGDFTPSNRENRNYIRKRKPIDFTMEDLIEDMEYLEDEEYVEENDCIEFDHEEESNHNVGPMKMRRMFKCKFM